MNFEVSAQVGQYLKGLHLQVILQIWCMPLMYLYTLSILTYDIQQYKKSPISKTWLAFTIFDTHPSRIRHQGKNSQKKLDNGHKYVFLP